MRFAHEIGPRNQIASRDISNAEIRYTERIRQTVVTSAAPVTLSDAVSHSASTDPARPPANISPAMGFQEVANPNPAQAEAIKRTDPSVLAAGEEMGDE